MANAFRAFVMTIVILVPAAVQAAMWEFSGGLNIEQSVAAGATTVPSPYFGGGFVTASLDDLSGLFSWTFGFGGLSDDATAAHFHAAAAGSVGPFIVTTPVSGTVGSFSGSVTLTDITLSGAIAALTDDGSFVPGDITGWYLNIHTDLNPGGELRAQLFVTGVVIPVPAALWLMISALGAIVGYRRLV